MDVNMLSFDSSTTATGYALFKNGKLNRYGVIEADPSQPVDERIKYMVINIYRMIADIEP